ncbi:MAG: hypothetical protein V1648_05275 [Candidatus Aenigmatarchaeota archaeon]
MAEHKIIDRKMINIAVKVENMKFDGRNAEFSKFCEGYNEAIENVIALIRKELQEGMQAGM